MLVAFPIELRDPVEESIVHLHFGRAMHYALYDTNTEKITVIKNESNHFGGTMLPPHFLHSKGVQMLVARHMGRQAFINFQNLGIEVMSTPEDIHVLKDVITKKEYWVPAEQAEGMIEGLKDAHGHGPFHNHHH